MGWRGVPACFFKVDPYGRPSINMYSWVLLLVVLGAMYVFLIQTAVVVNLRVYNGCYVMTPSHVR